MRHEVQPVNAPLSVADGTAIKVDRLVHKLVTVDGTFVATLTLQGKLAGGDWHDIQAAITAAAVIPIASAGGAELPYSFLRIKTTAYTSGTPVVFVAGYDPRAV